MPAKKSSPKSTCDLASRRCVPCEGDVPKLSLARARVLLRDIPGWRLRDGHLTRRVIFADFLALMKHVNGIARIAEAEGHHPDFEVHYNRLDLEIWTHAIDGLSENDFILAAKLSKLVDHADEGPGAARS